MTPSTYGALSDELEGLIERVRKATGPDRKIDIAVCLALNYVGLGTNDVPLNMRRSPDDPGGLDYELIEDGREVGCTDRAPHLTSSMDAAISFSERVLPGYSWGVDRTDEGDAVPWFDAIIGSSFAQHNTAPLAIILAALRSLQTGNAE